MIRNAMVMVALLPFIALVAMTGVFFYRDTGALMVAFVVYFCIYMQSHRTLFHSRFAHEAGQAGVGAQGRANDQR